MKKSSHLLMQRQKTADAHKAQTSRALAKSSEDVQLTERKMEENLRKKAVSHSDVISSCNDKPGLVDCETVVSKPCVCDRRTQVNVSDLFTRWDNLLLVLVCSLFVVILLSTPLNFFFARRGRR